MKSKQRRQAYCKCNAMEYVYVEDKVRAAKEELARLLRHIKQYEEKWGKL